MQEEAVRGSEMNIQISVFITDSCLHLTNSDHNNHHHNLHSRPSGVYLPGLSHASVQSCVCTNSSQSQEAWGQYCLQVVVYEKVKLRVGINC